tara:strand:+ start:414 stop:794 length:381 start_codon:yes stop_codon:yes gene_type:complete
MEKISEDDARFLLALNASEEAMLYEVVSEFGKWDCKKEDVLKVFRNLIEEEIIFLGRLGQGAYEDFSKEESLEAISSWEKLETHEILMFFTNQGYDLWENDDWGITKERAEYLFLNGDLTNVPPAS